MPTTTTESDASQLLDKAVTSDPPPDLADEPRSGRVTAAKAETRTRLARLLHAVELIPPKFRTLKGVRGKVDIVIDRDGRSTTFAIADQKTEALKRRDTFAYPENLDELRQLNVEGGKEADDDLAFRALAHGKLTEVTPEMLYLDVLEVHPKMRGKRAGTAFLQNLELKAKKIGYKFLVAHPDEPRATKFFLRAGFYLLDEVKDELQDDFIAADEGKGSKTMTINFLDEQDIKKYIQAERIGTNPANKLEFLKK